MVCSKDESPTDRLKATEKTEVLTTNSKMVVGPPPKNGYLPTAGGSISRKFQTKVQTPRFICGVNLKSQISNRLIGFDIVFGLRLQLLRQLDFRRY